jgi:hypothetical protein
MACVRVRGCLSSAAACPPQPFAVCRPIQPVRGVQLLLPSDDLFARPLTVLGGSTLRRMVHQASPDPFYPKLLSRNHQVLYTKSVGRLPCPSLMANSIHYVDFKVSHP